jgi:hypothetical protein
VPVQQIIELPVSGVLVSEVIGECPVNNYFHALLLDAGFGVPQHEAVRFSCCTADPSGRALTHFFRSSMLPRLLSNFTSGCPSPALITLVNGDLERDRLHPVADRLPSGSTGNGSGALVIR